MKASMLSGSGLSLICFIANDSLPAMHNNAYTGIFFISVPCFPLGFHVYSRGGS